MKIQRSCIFCNTKGNISKEHFWPQWFRQYLPEGVGDSYISEFLEGQAKSPLKLQKRTERQGKVLTKKIRVVCKHCNNGWMSALEENVKPTIVGLLAGSNYILDMDRIKTLALWATVKAIVGEHAEDKMALTPSSERYMVYKDQIIPGYFRVYVGMHSSETKSAYSRHSATISLTKDCLNPPTLPLGVRRNIQTVTFLVGSLVLHIVAVRVDGFRIDEALNPLFLIKLWSPVAEEIDLRKSEMVDDNRLRFIAGQLGTLIRAPWVRYGGPLPEVF